MRKRRIMALLTAFAVTFAMVITVSTAQVNAAKTKYEVPSKAIVYSNDFVGADPTMDNAKWEKGDVEKYDYKKGFVTRFDKLKCKWTINKKGKPTKVRAGSKKFGASSTGTYKNGKLSSVAFRMYNKKGTLVGKTNETYKYKKGWVSKVSGSINGYSYTASYTYRFYKNGVPRKVTETFKAYGDTTKQIYYFNKKGLITKIRYNDFITTFKYKYDDAGRVIEKITLDDDMPVYKTVYKYDGKTTKDRKTYMAIMNSPDFDGAVRDVLPSAYPLLAK